MTDSDSQHGVSMTFRAADVTRRGSRGDVIVGRQRGPQRLTAVHVVPDPAGGSAPAGALGTAKHIARRLRAEVRRLMTPATGTPEPGGGSPAERLEEFRALVSKGFIVLVKENCGDGPPPLSPAEAIDAGAGVVISRSTGGHLTVDFHVRHPIIRLPDPGADGDWTVTVHPVPGHPERRLLRIGPGDGAARQPDLADRIESAYTDGLRRSAGRTLFLERVTARTHGDSPGLEIEVDPKGRVPALRATGVRMKSAWDPENSASYVVDPTKPTTTRVLAHEARVRGHRPTIVTPNYLITEAPDGRLSGYGQTGTQFSTFTAVKAAGDKHIARLLFAGAGLSTARGAHFAQVSDLPAALRTLEDIGRVVVKPVDGYGGRGITVDVRTPDALRDAWADAFAFTRAGVLVEEMFVGTEVRFAVAGDTCAAATLRVPPTIVGDGTSTVRELIAAKNVQRRRNPHLVDRPIYLDRARLARLAEHGLTPLSVVPAGTEHVIDYRAGFSSGADSVDVTDEVHPSYHDIAVAAVRAIPGMVIGGVDLLISDPAVPATADNHIIVEVNSQPAIGGHHFPVRGQARNVAGSIIDAGLTGDRRPSTELDLAPENLDRSERRNPDAEALAQQFAQHGFTVEWLAPAYFHARRDGITTNVWGTYTSLTGHAAVTGAQSPPVAQEFLERAGLTVPSDRRQFRRDMPGTGYRHGKRARDYARTLPRAALRHGAQDPVLVDPDDPAAFRRIWENTCARSRGPVFVEAVPDGEPVSVLVAHGEALSVIRPEAPESAASVHRTYRDVAVRAVAAIPGLDIAEVVLAVADPQAAAAGTEHTVLVVRPRPVLAPYDEAVPDGPSVAARIVEGHIHALTAAYARTS